jgi:nitrogen-specific signal transduction histidine kinase/ActR/RegA family two-component response regulator
MERKVLELTEQLQQAQKMEALGRLAGGVAHDFNNLISVINGYADLLLADPNLPAHAHASLREVRSAGRRASDLTGQLLAFSRRQVIQLQRMDLNAVIADTQRMLRRLIGEDVELVTDLDPALGLTEADRGQIHQLLMNLAVNARDAMPKGGTLTLQTRAVNIHPAPAGSALELAPGRYATVAVTDTGCGMDILTLERIFEPFFTTKPQGMGTGLGLSTVYGIVKQLGGDVEVESEPGRGTTFRIYLPRLEEAAGTADSAEPVGPAPGGSETILLVEDEEMVRSLARRVLEGRGYHVLEAGCADEAIDLLRSYSGPLDLLLTDVVMPGSLNGRDLSLVVRATRPTLRSLFMTGYTDDVMIRNGVIADEVELMHKPFTPAILAQKVREALARDREGSARAAWSGPEQQPIRPHLCRAR